MNTANTTATPYETLTVRIDMSRTPRDNETINRAKQRGYGVSRALRALASSLENAPVLAEFAQEIAVDGKVCGAAWYEFTEQDARAVFEIPQHGARDSFELVHRVHAGDQYGPRRNYPARRQVLATCAALRAAADEVEFAGIESEVLELA